MRKVYIILGTSGSFSEKVEWIFKGVQTEKRAEEIVGELDTKLLELGLCCTLNYPTSHLDKEAEAKVRETLGDPRYQAGHGGSQYWWEEVEVEEEK